MLTTTPATTEPSELSAYRPTNIERRLYAALDALGIAFIPQHPVGWYILDSYLPAYRLAVEADGCGYHACEACGFTGTPRDEHRRAQDKARDTRLLQHYAIATIRIAGHDLYDEPSTLATVRAVLECAGVLPAEERSA